MPREPKLTPMQRNLIKNLVKGMSITDAARKAGYADNGFAGQMGSQALEAIRLKMPEVLERAGLTDHNLVEKYLKPALRAEETEFAKFEGKITDSRQVIAWGPRLTALDIAFNLKGSYAAKPLANVTVTVPIQFVTNLKLPDSAA